MILKNIITLNKNKRNCYIIDTIKGCRFFNKPGGCYGNCYAKKIFDRYKFDKNPVNRNFIIDENYIDLFGFKDEKHAWQISQKINKIKLSFIRIGDMGDPSENWEHTINICEQLNINKPIVIVTKHINNLSYNLLKKIEKINIIINTSISAMDSEYELNYRLNEYNKLKNHCKSVLRIVSCNFNKGNKQGLKMSLIQDKLFNNENIIDTIFRVNLDNKLVKQNIIKYDKVNFLDSDCFASIFNYNTYFGYCDLCPEMCGVNLF